MHVTLEGNENWGSDRSKANTYSGAVTIYGLSASASDGFTQDIQHNYAASGSAKTTYICSPSRGGPVQMTMIDGQPAFDFGGGVVSPGQPEDGEAYVVNSGHDPVTITAVTAIDLPGWQPGDLLRAAIATTGAGVAGARGWPPPVPEKAAIGGTLPHGLNQIIYGIAGNRVGRYYAIAGVKITYRYQGRTYSMLAWTALVACVAKSWRTGNESLCNAQVQKANTALEKLAG